MFLMHENIIRKLLDDVIPGVNVSGSFDLVRLTKADPIAIQVKHHGFNFIDQQYGDLKVANIFSIVISIDGALVDAAACDKADKGFTEIINRLRIYKRDINDEIGFINTKQIEWESRTCQIPLFISFPFLISDDQE